MSDIKRWNSYYKIDGIFFDEMSNTASQRNLNYYKKLYSSVKSLHPDWIVIGNPGTRTDSKFFSYTDIMVTFESSQSDYLNFIKTPEALPDIL